ncbi:MAG TPA: hypothetical protein VIO57_10375 [Chloroflexota bacterium]
MPRQLKDASPISMMKVAAAAVIEIAAPALSTSSCHVAPPSGLTWNVNAAAVQAAGIDMPTSVKAPSATGPDSDVPLSIVAGFRVIPMLNIAQDRFIHVRT